MRQPSTVHEFAGVMDTAIHELPIGIEVKAVHQGDRIIVTVFGPGHEQVPVVQDGGLVRIGTQGGGASTVVGGSVGSVVNLGDASGGLSF